MKKFMLLFSIMMFGLGFAQTIDTIYVDDSYGSPAFVTESFVDTWYDVAVGWLGTSKGLSRNSAATYGHNATWTPTIENPAYYSVAYYLPMTGNSRNNALWVIAPFGETADSFHYNQNKNSGSWITMGVYYLLDGSFVRVVDDSTSTSGYVFRADAVRFISAQGTPDIEVEWRNPDGITNMNFAETNIGGSKEFTLDIWNIGDQLLEVTNFTGSTGLFTVTDPEIPFDVDPHSKATTTISFTPLSERIYIDTLYIESNDPLDPEIPVAVQGEGTQVTVLVNNDDGPPYYMEHIGTWNTSNGAAQCPAVENPTSQWIHYATVDARAEFKPNIPADGLYSVFYVGPATENASVHALHEIHPFGGAIDSVWIDQNAGSSCEDKYLGTYYFLAGDLNSVYTVVDGTASGIYAHRADIIKFISVPDRPKIYISEDYYEFADIQVDSTAYWGCSISNVGGEALSISNVTTSGDFFDITEPATFPLTIDPLDSGSFKVSFTPAEITDYRDTVTVYSNDLDYPEITIIVEGNGIGILKYFDNDDETVFSSGPLDTTWSVSTSTSGYGASSLFADKRANPDAWCEWAITVPEELEYVVSVSSVPSSSEFTSTICPFIVESALFSDTLLVDQTTTTSSNIWIELGRYTIDPNLGMTVKIQNDTLVTFGEDGIANTIDDGGMVIRADAVKVEEPAVGIELVFSPNVPGYYRLDQNYPNPFNPVTTIRYGIPVNSKVELSIYNLLGQKVKTLVAGDVPAGEYLETWDGTNQMGEAVSSGMYIYRLKSDNFVMSKKMLFLK